MCLKTHLQLEGAQKVHISAKYTIMLSCTCLHVYIHASLVMYVRVHRWKSAREHCLIQASLGSSRTVWCISTNEWSFCGVVCSRRLLGECASILRDITVKFLYISPKPPLRSWTWLYHQKANKTTFPTISCLYKNIVNFSHTSRVHFLANNVIPPI